MSAIRTARERARAEVMQEIKDEARRQLATVGAAGLSLRAVARELGMASSGLYRYFANRDALLTALIIDAYNEIGERVEVAERAVPAQDYRARWRAFCMTIREWAIAAPHQYALVYGSPVPGYQAPQDTVGPASRIPLTLIRNVHDAWTAGALQPPEPLPSLSAVLTEQAARVARETVPGVPEVVVTLTLIALTQLFGMLTFELFGHFVGSMDPAGPFFEFTVERMAGLIGLS
jgi:AcrR family transcriptional regulator